MEIFKQTQTQKNFDRLKSIPIQLKEEDFKAIMEIIKVPQELLLTNTLDEKEHKTVMEALKKYSDTIQFLYIRRKQMQEYYGDTKRQL